MSRSIQLTNAVNSVNLDQKGFTVSFTDEFNVFLNGVEFTPHALRDVAEHMIREQQQIKRKKLEDLFWEWESRISFYPEMCPAKVGGIYTIGDFYVGRSKNIYGRIKQHLYQIINGKHCNKALCEKVRKHFEEEHYLMVFWKECEPTDLNEAIIISNYLDNGIDLVNIDLRGLSLINKN